MKINSIPSFSAKFDNAQFHKRAKDEAYNTERIEDYIEAENTISSYLPNGVISRYSYEGKDVYTVIPREPLEITIPKNPKSPTRHLDSLIGLQKILKQICPEKDD